MKNVEDITHFPPETGTQEGGGGAFLQDYFEDNFEDCF